MNASFAITATSFASDGTSFKFKSSSASFRFSTVGSFDVVASVPENASLIFFRAGM